MGGDEEQGAGEMGGWGDEESNLSPAPHLPRSTLFQ